jgi:hypothetical protein
MAATAEEEQECWQTHISMDLLDDTPEMTDEEVAALSGREEARRVARLSPVIQRDVGGGGGGLDPGRGNRPAGQEMPGTGDESRGSSLVREA